MISPFSERLGSCFIFQGTRGAQGVTALFAAGKSFPSGEVKEDALGVHPPPLDRLIACDTIGGDAPSERQTSLHDYKSRTGEVKPTETCFNCKVIFSITHCFSYTFLKK